MIINQHTTRAIHTKNVSSFWTFNSLPGQLAPSQKYQYHPFSSSHSQLLPLKQGNCNPSLQPVTETPSHQTPYIYLNHSKPTSKK